MDDAERSRYEASAQQLRSDLKRFESDWAIDHAGSKPQRDDIKRNPDIASKYKQYNHVRDVLAGKAKPKPEPRQAASTSRSRKRPSPSAPDGPPTPSKRPRPQETPSKPRHHNVDADPEDPSSLNTPSSRKLFSPQVPSSIGPTPQKNGRILGLFDLLPQDDDAAHPSGIHATPSKRRAAPGPDSDLARTPISTSKRARRDSSSNWVTPLKPRNPNAQDITTPTSVSKLHFATPSFLRRAPLEAVDENGEYKSPEPLRLPRKPFGRSLSSVVASLRKIEDEEHDDDMDAMREMEMEGENSLGARPVAASKPQSPASKNPGVHSVSDSQQAPRLLGAFDDEGAYDSPDEDPSRNLDRNGQPLKIYKKKGQKRTTRRSNMKPVLAKRPGQAATGENGTDLDSEDGDDVVPETQVRDMDGSMGPDSDAEWDLSDSDEGAAKSKKKRKTTKTASKEKTRKDGKAESNGGVVQKAARKVNELAHANFKRLKLRNHGAKGGPSFGSKFRRRR